jgi:glucokinase
VSCGGRLDSRRGVVLSPPNLQGWDEVPIVAMLQEATGLPVRLENDANAGALAEWLFGAGRGPRSVVLLQRGEPPETWASTTRPAAAPSCTRACGRRGSC